MIKVDRYIFIGGDGEGGGGIYILLQVIVAYTIPTIVHNDVRTQYTVVAAN